MKKFTQKDFEECVLSMVKQSEGIKRIILVDNIVNTIKQFDSDVISLYESLNDIINELIFNSKIKEVECVMPNITNRKVYFLFPIGTKIYA